MEFFVEDMKNLPMVVERRLTELRKLDTDSNATLKSSAADEAQLFEELASLAKADPEFDEGPITEKFQLLLARRHDTLNVLDDQMKKIQKLYDLVDGRITFIDSSTKEIAHLFPQGSVERGMANRKKKRKKSNTDDSHSHQTEEVFPDNVVAFDPNEPVYCTCRQVSFGNMIACENPECAIEWYHFACVGLKADPGEPWFCAQCREQ